MFPKNEIVKTLELHFLTEKELAFVGLKVIFQSKKEFVIGNVSPVIGKPHMEELTLENDERIVGVKFKQPKEDRWLPL